MTYLADVSVPVNFEADSDEAARLILLHIQDVIAALSLPHAAEIHDAPSVTLAETLPYVEPRPIVGPADSAPDGCSECAAIASGLQPMVQA